MISFLQRKEHSAPFAQPLKKNRSDRKFKYYSHQLQIVFYKWYIYIYFISTKHWITLDFKWMAHKCISSCLTHNKSNSFYLIEYIIYSD